MASSGALSCSPTFCRPSAAAPKCSSVEQSSSCSPSAAAAAAGSVIGIGVGCVKFPHFSSAGARRKPRGFRVRQHSAVEAAAGKNVLRCECYDLFEELVPYVEAWKWQKETVDRMCVAQLRGEEPSDSVILLQHPPVYTMGTRSSDSYLRFDKENPPFELHRTERGGEVTYHGPGQLVMYPILNLRHRKTDLHWYLRMLEEVVIRTLWSACGLKGSRIDGLTGVWVGEVKVAAIGIRVSRWITYHGLALNVNTDLTPFQNIVPCGISDRPVGSIQQLLKNRKNLQNRNSTHSASNLLFSSSQQSEREGHRTGIASKLLEDTTKKTVWDDAMMLQCVHNSLLAEFAELFQLELVPPTRVGPKALS